MVHPQTPRGSRIGRDATPSPAVARLQHLLVQSKGGYQCQFECMHWCLSMPVCVYAGTCAWLAVCVCARTSEAGTLQECLYVHLHLHVLSVSLSLLTRSRGNGSWLRILDKQWTSLRLLSPLQRRQRLQARRGLNLPHGCEWKRPCSLPRTPASECENQRQEL